MRSAWYMRLMSARTWRLLAIYLETKSVPGSEGMTRSGMAGFGQTSKVEVLRSGLQRDIHIVHFAKSAPIDQLSYAHPEELADRYAKLFAVEDILELSPTETGLIGLLNERSDMAIPFVAPF